MTDQSLLEAYLTEYQPDRKAELLHSGTLAAYLAEQAAAMQEARSQLRSDLKAQSPWMSQTQLELEAEQQLREMFLPLP